MGPLIGLHRVVRTYPSRPRPWSAVQLHRALDGVSLELNPGDVLAVVGDSGSGKSTLARVAAGLEAPDEGEVRFEGQDLRSFDAVEWKRRRRIVQLVFQEAASALDPRLSVRSSIEEPLWVQGLPTQGEARRLAEQVQLDPSTLDRSPHELSGGQKQRVGLARALALSPRVLVLDEPLASLDASAGAHILNLLQELRHTQGLTLMWVTHDLRAAQSFATRVAVLQAGRVVEEGPAHRVWTTPQHPHTQALLAASPPGLRLDPESAPDSSAGVARIEDPG